MVSKTVVLTMPLHGAAVIALAYDDDKCLDYFGTPVEGWWKQSFDSMPQLLEAAFADYSQIMGCCQSLSDEICGEAEAAFGETY